MDRSSTPAPPRGPRACGERKAKIARVVAFEDDVVSGSGSESEESDGSLEMAAVMGSELAPSPPARVEALPAAAVAAPEHKWTVLRSGRKAGCQACQAEIGPWDFKACFHPRICDAEDRRLWRTVFKRHFHISRVCLKDVVRKPSSLAMIGVDQVNALPKRMVETPEQYAAAIEAARATLWDCFA